jgi:hypothetical protein
MISLCIGRRTRGKSTLAYAIALQSDTRVIFDPRRQFGTTDDIIFEPGFLYESMSDRSEIIVQPHEEISVIFERVCFEIYDWIDDNQTEVLAFLVDEVRFLDTPGKSYPNFEKVLRFCDPEKVNVILTCHRPVDISVDIRAIADFWCMFQTTQEHDLSIIYQRCGQECANAVRDLRGKEFILWNDGEGTFTKKMDSSSWFVDIKRKAVIANA